MLKELRKQRLEGARAGEPGYLYVVQFDNGVVKIGKAHNADARLSDHETNAGRFGLSIVQRWSSDIVHDVDASENELRCFCRAIGVPTASGREYFCDLPFTVAVHQAHAILAWLQERNFDREALAQCWSSVIRPVASMQTELTAVDAPAPRPANIRKGLRRYPVVGGAWRYYQLPCGGTVKGYATDHNYTLYGDTPLRAGDRFLAELYLSLHSNHSKYASDPRWTVKVIRPPERCASPSG